MNVFRRLPYNPEVWDTGVHTEESNEKVFFERQINPVDIHSGSE